MVHFIIATENATEAQRDAVTKHFSGKSHFGYWHWIQNVWLINCSDHSQTASALRDTVRDLTPGAYVMVLKVEIPRGESWAGFAPPKWSEWIKDYWKS